jgi:hypothetical protein
VQFCGHNRVLNKASGAKIRLKAWVYQVLALFFPDGLPAAFKAASAGGQGALRARTTVSRGYTVRFRDPTEGPKRTLWVDGEAKAGGDGSELAPFRTIEAAAAAAQAGDTVRVRPGVYRGQVTPPRSGTPGAWIRFVADGTGMELDGGETIPTSKGWAELEGGVWGRPYGRSPHYMSLEGVRLYRHSSLSKLRNKGDGIEGGFFVSSGVLYVKTPDGAPL